jgi:hypothetical protein
MAAGAGNSKSAVEAYYELFAGPKDLIPSSPIFHLISSFLC